MQGGIGTFEEDKFLKEFYNLDGTGWGSPFLMVPEATNVDEGTMKDLVESKKEDFYLSYASPLGIPFNNFKRSSSEKQRLKRIEKGRPGSPCYLKFLSFNTEFNAEKPICIASREYQNLKLKELDNLNESDVVVQLEREKILEKDCLCEGLSSTVLIKNKLPLSHKLEAVTICPGPNAAYFSKVLSLEQLVGHIYGRGSVLSLIKRPHIFINELKIYFDYLKEEVRRNSNKISKNQLKTFNLLYNNLMNGLNYYRELFTNVLCGSEISTANILKEIKAIERQIDQFYNSEKANAIFEFEKT